MRRFLRLILLITFIAIPAYGLVLQNEPPHSDSSATSSPDVAPPSTYNPPTSYRPPQSNTGSLPSATATPNTYGQQAPQSASQTRQPTTAAGQMNTQLSSAVGQLSNAQRNELLRQSQNLSPQQLEAIAKSFQSQQTVQPYPQSQSQTGPQPSAYATASQTGTSSAQQQQMAYAASGTQTPSYATGQAGAGAMAMPEPTPGSFYQDDSSNDLLAHIESQKENKASLEKVKRDEAFSMLLEEVLPLSPEQIKRLHRFYDLTLEAKATPAHPSPEPHFTSTHVRLDPGCPTPVVRLSAGFISSILFIDATGAPWPITAYSLGDPESFNIQWDQKTNVIFIQSRKVYAHGNLAVRLYGLDTPVMITLVSGQKNVDFRVDMQIGERGPDAKAPLVETVFDAKVNPILINLLDGVPPKSSVKLAVIGGFGDAWTVDNKIYFRTKLTVLSPAWIATVASPDGTHVYEMMLTPYILASQNGKTVDIKLSGL